MREITEMDELREEVRERLKGMPKNDREYLVLQGMLTIIKELHEIKEKKGKVKKEKKE